MRATTTTISLSVLSLCLSSVYGAIWNPSRAEAQMPFRFDLDRGPPEPLGALHEHLSFVPDGFHVDLDERRLVRFADDEDPVWMTERQKFIAKARGLKFFDITEVTNGPFQVKRQQVEENYGVYNVSKNVKAVVKTLSTEGPKENLKKFTSFRTRYYRSDSGRESQLWLLNKIKEITSTGSADLQSRISITEFEHSWPQRTIIVNIKGALKDSNGTVILSAHQDSINTFPFLPAPGADDDGSGSVTILETYRALVKAGFAGIHDVEFHWYSAEEGGLLGSQAVATEYASQSAKVKALLHYDMTAWVKKGTPEQAALMTDNSNPRLTSFLKSLITTYLSIPPVESTCGYACSDHASWDKLGYSVAIGSESRFEITNHHLHSAQDRIDISDEFSFEHLLEFAKLGVAFVVEVAGWA